MLISRPISSRSVRIDISRSDTGYVRMEPRMSSFTSGGGGAGAGAGAGAEGGAASAVTFG